MRFSVIITIGCRIAQHSRMWLSLGSEGSAAGGGVKRPERVAAVDKIEEKRSPKILSGTATGRALALGTILYQLNNNRMWLSLVERLLWEQDAAGSNPVIRTI